jgi:hypothetical protein
VIATMRPTAPRELAVLETLERAGERGACLTDMPERRVYSARNAISRLRRDGFVILGGPCRVHRHRATVYRYWLDAA